MLEIVEREALKARASRGPAFRGGGEEGQWSHRAQAGRSLSGTCVSRSVLASGVPESTSVGCLAAEGWLVIR